MARITVEDFDQMRHGNPMASIDNAQAERRHHAGSLAPYRVCMVHVAGFKFIFHSTTQLELCLEYYRLEHLPSSSLPFYTMNLGDHWETQRWFEKLPGRLRANRVRGKVIAALEEALARYALEPGAVTGTPKPKLFWSPT